MTDDGPVTEAWDRFVASLPHAQAMAAHNSGLALMIWQLEFNASNARRELESALGYLTREPSAKKAEAA